MKNLLYLLDTQHTISFRLEDNNEHSISLNSHILSGCVKVCSTPKLDLLSVIFRHLPLSDTFSQTITHMQLNREEKAKGLTAHRKRHGASPFRRNHTR
jgi:hypothetical protein